MAQSRFYSATAQPTVLTASITPTDVIIQLQQVVGFPVNTPYILALDYNSPSEEIVLVTAAAGVNLTVTRGYDGTSAASHGAGAAVRHTWTAKDGNDSRAHEGSTSGVHGVAGNVVGTTDTQTLTNKTLTSPVINSPSFGGTVTLASPTITGTVAGGASYTGITATNPTITGTVAGGASYTSPTITSPTVTGTVAGGGSYQNITVTTTSPGTTPLQVMAQPVQTNPLQIWQDSTPATLARVRQGGELSSNVGLQCGPANQFSVNASGNVTTSGTLAAGNTTVNGNLSVTGIGFYGFARKTGDTQRNNTTTLTNDPDLTIAVVANGVYEIGGLLLFRADAAGDFKMQFGTPAGGAYASALTGQPTGASATTGIVITDSQSFSASFGGIGSGASTMTVVPKGIFINGANAGNFTVQWAQDVSNANFTTLLGSSFITLRRVA